MSEKIFISYSHDDGDWVTDRLEPVLTAAGVEVLIDTQRFRAGHALVGEMDATQDSADRSILVLSPSYLKSDYCQHEMKRAIARDPVKKGRTLPVLRKKTPLPEPLSKGMYVDLLDDGQAHPWSLLLDGCAGELGTTAPAWLHARDEVRRYLDRGQSVNLEVQDKPKWREMLVHLRDTSSVKLFQVDLDEGRTTTRRGMVETILEACGTPTSILEGEELIVLDRSLTARPRTHLAFLHFDRAPHRDPTRIDFFATLRNLIMDKRKLVALFHTRRPFTDLLPKDHPLSDLEVKSVELPGTP